MKTCQDCGKEIEEGLMAYVNHHYLCEGKLTRLEQLKLNDKPTQMMVYTGSEGIKEWNKVVEQFKKI